MSLRLTLMNFSISVVTITSLLFFSVPNLEASQFIRRVGEWEKPPDVVLCDTSIITKEKLTSVVMWWEDLGYEFGSTTVNPQHRGCSGNVGGTITITLSKLGAHTRFLEKNEKLHWAKIKAPADSPTIIIAHEIGHALGWTHIRDKGHIMNGRYTDTGWFSAGLRIGHAKSFPGARSPRRGGPVGGAYR